MRHGVLPRALLVAALLIAPLPALAQPVVPALKARVTDLTSTLTAEQRAALEQKLASLEARKGSQVAVLLVPTTRPEPIEQYSIRVVDQWKLGRKNVDDGVLLLVAKDDRALRIEVGRGLEGAIPDAYAKRIIEEAITPRFREGNFYAGIEAGVDRIAKLVDGEPMPPPTAPSPGGSSRWDPELVLYGFFALLAVVHMLQAALGRLLGSAVVGAVAGGIVFFMAGLSVALGTAVFIFLASLILSPLLKGMWSSAGGYSGRGRGGGWSSGGGYSGGGGGFGGGGASGRW